MPAASAAATAARPWDVIVFGASGFVGRLVAAHLATSPTAAGLSIALAGRSWAGLSKMSAELVAKQRLGAKPFGIVYADITQPETIDTMAASARVIINLVGPYALYVAPPHCATPPHRARTRIESTLFATVCACMWSRILQVWRAGGARMRGSGNGRRGLDGRDAVGGQHDCQVRAGRARKRRRYCQHVRL